MNCKYFTIRQKDYKRHLYCKLSKEFKPDCQSCEFRENKPIKLYKAKPKKDYNKISIMPSSSQYRNQKTKGYHKHHCMEGSNRKNSEKYGLFVWLLPEQHNMSDYGVHGKYGKEFDLELKRTAQKAFESLYGHKAFMLIFGKNYL